MTPTKTMLVLSGLLSLPLYATESSSNDISQVKQELELLKNKLEKLEAAQATAKTQSSKEVTSSKGEVKVYASLRPTFGRIDDHGDDFSDVQDALSNAGFKSTYEFKPGWTAIMHGEWSVDIANNADFGTARQVYVGVRTPYGQVAIGKQRPVQYTLIAEYVDIFNHRSSPFAYDVEGPFFVDNLVTYEHTIDNFKFMLGGQFNGPSGEDDNDFFNTGLAYDADGLHLALAYSSKNEFDENDIKLGGVDVLGFSVAKEFDSGVYAAAAYQSVDYDFIQERDGDTVDVSLGYRFAPEYRVKVGYFAFDDGKVDAETENHDGANLTLEWLPSDNLRFHLEYLTKSYDELEDSDSITIGFRYDYANTWQY